MVKLANSWIIMNPGGGPTPDKPGISVVNYEPGDTTSIFLNLRVADIEACSSPVERKGRHLLSRHLSTAARRYVLKYATRMGYLIEIGQSTGLLRGELAKKRPEDLPG